MYRACYRLPRAFAARPRGHRVAIVDGVMSAGSALRGTCAEVESHSAMPVVAGASMVLGSTGAQFEERGIAVEAVARHEYEPWRPSECPLCAAGVPLEDVTAPATQRPARGGRMVRLSIVLVALLASACSSAPPTAQILAGQLVDLSHTFDEQTIFWPTADAFHLQSVASGITPADYYAANNFSMAEHGGTHLDAPIHFAEGHHTVDQIPVDRLVGSAVVVDVTASSNRDADYQVAPADLLEWERQHGQIPPDTIVLFYTGFAVRWPDAARYLGTAERGPEAVPKLHFPGIHPDAARWLIGRSVKAVGVDTASIDYGQSTGFESHRLLYAQNIPAFENLTGLDKLPARGALVIALPMKIKGGSGAPLRAVAVVPPGQS